MDTSNILNKKEHWNSFRFARHSFQQSLLLLLFYIQSNQLVGCVCEMYQFVFHWLYVRKLTQIRERESKQDPLWKSNRRKIIGISRLKWCLNGNNIADEMSRALLISVLQTFYHALRLDACSHGNSYLIVGSYDERLRIIFKFTLP